MTLFALLFLVGRTCADDSAQISADKLREHCRFLASDTLEGREAGTAGGRAASAYLREQFRDIGVKPAAGDGDYFQEFDRGYRNIVGMVPGSDPRLSSEYVMVGAHYDHVGYARRGNAYGPIGQIHNGADDNASGTSALLEVARVIAAMEPPPKRSILFVLWDAEEIGLRGSEHWLRASTVSKENIRLSVNVDMIGRLRNDTVNMRGSRTMQGLRWLLTGANLESDLLLEYDWRHKRDSDHYPFYRARIPYLSFDTGKHEDYHRPSDDPHRLNIEGLRRVSQLLLGTIVTAAQQDELTRFRREAVTEAMRSDDWWTRTPAVFPIRLGLAWHTRTDISEPIRAREIDSDSPADRAGLRVGDVILRCDGQETVGRDDFRLRVAMAESPLELIVGRAGEPEPLVVSVDLIGDAQPWGILTREDSAEPNMPIVAGIIRGSPAESAGVEIGDRLILAPPREFLKASLSLVLFDPDEFEGVSDDVIVVERKGRIERLQAVSRD